MQTITKVFLIIAVVFMTGALLTQSIYVYKLNALQTLVAEEEPHEEKLKSNSKDLKDKFISFLRFNSSIITATTFNACFCSSLIYCKGFANKPYTPPDIA